MNISPQILDTFRNKPEKKRKKTKPNLCKVLRIIHLLFTDFIKSTFDDFCLKWQNIMQYDLSQTSTIKWPFSSQENYALEAEIPEN